MTILSSPGGRNLGRDLELKIVVFLSLFFITFAAQAAHPLDVIINEVAWMGTTDGANYEWIELYNTKEEKIDLSGWKIENAGAGNKTLEISTGEISPKEFFLICKKEIKNCDFITGTLSLHNEYEKNGKLILRDNLNNVLDQTPKPESKKWPAGDNSTKQTMERKKPQFEGSDPDDWQTSQNAGGTPKAKNSITVQAEPQPKPESEKTAKENIIPVQGTEEAETFEETGKIDINTALLKDLVKIVHIGEVRAEELISLRPFYSLDDLTRIKGIGDKTLEDIKKQGLAWVDPTLEPPKIEKTESLEKGLAAVAEPLKPFTQSKKTQKPLSIFLIALALAIFSGIITLILKRKLKNASDIN